ncbi:unnamed protein product [Rhizophagus irregularis]|nr:unnamed protein product [Rhizophagus irregularis]
MSKFQKSNWKSDVLFINEYDTSLVADDDVKTSFLGAIRNIKNSKRHYALWSAVVIGPLRYLRVDKRACWPCLPLWQGYQFFRKNLTKEDLDFVLWSNFVASLQLTVRMITYNTFKKMVDNLITLDIAKGALDLLQSVF